MGAKGLPCDFDLCEDATAQECKDEDKWTECRVLTKEGIAFNVNQCLVQGIDPLTGNPVNHRATCHNNCKGVNPNAITAAGVALTALSGIGSTAGLGPGAVGLVGAVGAGEVTRRQQTVLMTFSLLGREVMNQMNTCPEGFCRMNGNCCRLIRRRGRMICPLRPNRCRS